MTRFSFISLYGIMPLFLLLFIAGGVIILWGQMLYTNAGPLDKPITLEIKKGMGTSDISKLLKDKDVISNELLFKSMLFINQNAGKLKAGSYEFSPKVSMATVQELIVKGRDIALKITFPEGFTSWQIVDKLRANSNLTGAITDIPPEGSLSPNTYNYTAGQSRQAILDKMKKEQTRILEEIWAKRSNDLPIKTSQELIVLASLVEKETGIKAERREVAGVFVNRLRRGMKLQSDPTVIYGLTLGVGSLGRGLKKSELEKPTPYNTYIINGLPDKPIANPGRAALEAAANPAETKNYYFVADGTGGHIFAETYSEHQKNVANWRKIERSKAN